MAKNGKEISLSLGHKNSFGKWSLFILVNGNGHSIKLSKKEYDKLAADGVPREG